MPSHHAGTYGSPYNGRMHNHSGSLPSTLFSALQHDGFSFVTADVIRPLLESVGDLSDWAAFADSWNQLGPDPYLAAKGRFLSTAPRNVYRQRARPCRVGATPSALPDTAVQRFARRYPAVVRTCRTDRSKQRQPARDPRVLQRILRIASAFCAALACGSASVPH